MVCVCVWGGGGGGGAKFVVLLANLNFGGASEVIGVNTLLIWLTTNTQLRFCNKIIFNTNITVNKNVLSAL